VTSRGIYFMGIMMAGGVAMAVAVGLQHFFVFRSEAAVAATTALLAIAAWLVTRSSLDTFAVAMRFNLAVESAEMGAIYTEVGA
jgi:hypothetical protein